MEWSDVLAGIIIDTIAALDVWLLAAFPFAGIAVHGSVGLPEGATSAAGGLGLMGIVMRGGTNGANEVVTAVVGEKVA